MDLKTRYYTHFCSGYFYVKETSKCFFTMSILTAYVRIYMYDCLSTFSLKILFQGFCNVYSMIFAVITIDVKPFKCSSRVPLHNKYLLAGNHRKT